MRLPTVTFAALAALMIPAGSASASIDCPTDAEVAAWAGEALTPWVTMAERLEEVDVDGGAHIIQICAQLLDDVNDLQDVPDYPYDPAMWNYMLDELSAAFASCAAGDLSEAEIQMTKANTILEVFNVSLTAKAEQLIN